jgi:hypothetical protein
VVRDPKRSASLKAWAARRVRLPSDSVEYRVEQSTAKLEHRSARFCGWRTLAIAQMTPMPVVEDTIARQ